MRRPQLALALLLVGAAVTAQQASTASSSVAPSTAVARDTTVTGAAMLSLRYTTAAGTIVAVKPRLRGTGLRAGTLSNLTPRTVTAQFGSDLPVACVVTTSKLLDALTGAAEATYDCAGTVEPADRPARLLIKVR